MSWAQANTWSLVMVREAAASIIATAAAQPTPALREAAAIGYLAVLESRCVAYFAMALTSEATRTLRSRLAEARGAIPDYGYAQVASWARDVIPREILITLNGRGAAALPCRVWRH